MARINVYRYYDDNDKTLEGWFDPDTATRFDQDTEWDGNNMIGVITKSQWIDEFLYRTKGGRWVLNHDEHRCHNGPDTYEFITDEHAKDWLLRSERNDDAIKKYFGELEEERGPGRPSIGEPVNIRFPEDVLSALDKRAATTGVSRAEVVRRLVVAGLGADR